MSSYALDINVKQIFICCLFHSQYNTLSEPQQAGKILSTFRFFQAQYPTVKTLFIPRGYAREHIPENLVGKRGGTAKV